MGKYLRCFVCISRSNRSDKSNLFEYGKAVNRPRPSVEMLKINGNAF